MWPLAVGHWCTHGGGGGTFVFRMRHRGGSSDKVRTTTGNVKQWWEGETDMQVLGAHSAYLECADDADI